MIISDYIDNNSFINRLEDLNEFIGKASSKVSFWGSRVITVEGYAGSYKLNDLSEKVLAIGRKFSEQDDMTLLERINGIEITKKLQSLYKQSDDELGKVNWFSRLLNWVSELSLYPYTTRFWVENSLKRDFRSFSEAKFKEVFGEEMSNPSFKEYLHADGSSGPPVRIHAKEESIRRLLHEISIDLEKLNSLD